MAIGSRRKSSGGYVFVDGRAMRADDVMDSSVQETAVPGGGQEAYAPGAGQQRSVPGASGVPGMPGAQGAASQGGTRTALRKMSADEAFALRDGAALPEGLLGGGMLLADDKRKMRRLYLIFGLVLLVCLIVSFCAEPLTLTWRTPIEVAQGLATWVSVFFTQLIDPAAFADARAQAIATSPDYESIAFQFGNTIKYALCGIMVSVSGMLYQNAFRNPIAAPSMLGVTNGISFALLILVLQFGEAAYGQLGLYYLYSYIGGAVVLGLVILGGAWTSGRRKFNVVNMILIGTIISQLLGVVLTYLQNNFLGDMDWMVYSELVEAVNVTSVWTYVSMLVGTLGTLLPIFLFRFRLNLVSFSDEETRFLGVDPNKLRLLALGCGSVMILTAQVNAGQVAMISLVVPFVVRAVFGSEFRKQLGGNMLVGAILLVVCGLLSEYIVVNYVGIGLGPISTLIALPLFVWMLAIRQRSWD